MFLPLAQYVRQSGESMTRTRTTKARLIGCTVACLATVIAVAAPTALADHVSCGAVLTKSVKLDSDLNCPPQVNGLYVGADDITIDLKSHTISGVIGDGPGESPTYGVLVSGYDGAKVKNGTITGFSGGVLVDDTDGNRLLGLRLVSNGHGARLVDADSNQILDTVASNGFFGIVLQDDSEGNLVENNTASSNSGFGISLGGSDWGSPSDNTLIGNEAHSNGRIGFVVQGDVTETLLESNRANSNGEHGFFVGNSTTTLTRNVANFNFDLGIQAAFGVTDGGGNKASGNGNPLQCTNVNCK